MNIKTAVNKANNNETMNHILPGIAVIIFNEKGEVLLQRRRDTHKWCIICGHVDFGETVENTGLREIREETGCCAEIVRFIGIYSNPASQTYHYPGKTVQFVTSYFEAKLTSEIDLSFTNEETEELKYFCPDRLPEDMGMINENRLRDALSKTETSYIR